MEAWKLPSTSVEAYIYFQLTYFLGSWTHDSVGSMEMVAAPMEATRPCTFIYRIPRTIFRTTVCFPWKSMDIFQGSFHYFHGSSGNLKVEEASTGSVQAFACLVGLGLSFLHGNFHLLPVDVLGIGEVHRSLGK